MNLSTPNDPEPDDDWGVCVSTPSEIAERRRRRSKPWVKPDAPSTPGWEFPIWLYSGEYPLPCDHVVYMAFNDADRCLYVGVTSDFTARMRAHFRNSLWWAEMEYVLIDLFDSRLEAEATEILRIHEYAPLRNHRGILS